MTTRYDVAVIGGGIVGLATAHAIGLRHRASVVVLEAENQVASHQTGHNSGVIHSGLYYRPGSLKARNCVTGREAMYRFCKEHGIPHERCGKVVVATDAAQLPALDELERRGRANGLEDVERLGPEALREREPHVHGVAALVVPDTGIVDFSAVARELARQIEEQQGDIRRSSRVLEVTQRGDAFTLTTAEGEVESRGLINCGGLQADRIARLCGLHPKVRVVPFRGEYKALKPERRHLVRHLIYPVPDPRFPFLGVHFTRTIDGDVEAGPNALFAFKREGYTRWSFSARDTIDSLSYSGFLRLALRYWRTGMMEWYCSIHAAAMLRQLQKLLPELRASDLVPGGAGVRAMAVSPAGAILDDFVIEEAERMLHVLNAPSPAATAALSIGATLAERASAVLALPLQSK
ncbi:MAG: L-2-hydroxyglutarate oxidase [Candidatus Latescibacterota bacterium]|nr:MAG: L-2-hydroxyglutarate oxidase [Candidatus Latescibacterota bacterium]